MTGTGADRATSKWRKQVKSDESILLRHLVTDIFLFFYTRERGKPSLWRLQRQISNYMMFLFVKHPYMPPSPVRSRLYGCARQKAGAVLPLGKERMFQHKEIVPPFINYCRL
jgi:hypothetical protein